MASLDHVRQSLDKSAVNRAVDLLTQAKNRLFGLGSSAAVAHDAMNKFFRFNVPVIYSDDIVLQRMSCMNCNDDDVVVLISHTGRTKSLVELAQLARENDAMVIALTSAGTPLAREATLAITLDVPEDTDIYMPMVSRLAQLTVIDVLATGFTLRRGAKFRDNLKRVKEALKESRFDKELPSGVMTAKSNNNVLPFSSSGDVHFIPLRFQNDRINVHATPSCFSQRSITCPEGFAEPKSLPR